MDGGAATERARQPEDLDRLFLERANAGDVDGVMDLYEPHAVLAFPPGHLAVGRQAIREVYADLLAGRPRLTGVIRPASANASSANARAGASWAGPMRNVMAAAAEPVIAHPRMPNVVMR